MEKPKRAQPKKPGSTIKKKSVGLEKTSAPRPMKKSEGAQNKTFTNDRPAQILNEADFYGVPTKAMSCAEQRAFVLSTLAISGGSSYWFRSNGCYQVPTRVFELRKAGFDIRTSWTTVVDADGWSHPRCAFYELGNQGQTAFDFDYTAPAANDPHARMGSDQ